MAQSIKGLTLRSRVAFVKHNYGPEGMTRLIYNLKGQARELMASPATINTSGWYDFDVQLDVDRAICKVLAEGDTSVYRAMGAYSAEFEISKEDASTSEDLRRFLKLQMTLFSHYFKPGTVELVTVSDNEVLVRVSGFASVRENCDTNMGFLKRCVELRGAEGVTIEEPKCSQDPTAGVCEYRLKWK